MSPQYWLGFMVDTSAFFRLGDNPPGIPKSENLCKSSILLTGVETIRYTVRLFLFPGQAKI